MLPGNDAGHAVEVADLVKRYPKASVNAVDGVSFSVAAGEVFGLLGPNGAGKTTTVGMLTTRVRPTSGRALVGGVDVMQDPVRARRQVAVVPQRSN
ncbi:MAG TPA: ATP-binding cassette domain-containing protein, partial [Gaiellaceae bacterium]|nr:ATP-binding cassette domain-containing protein [Gaiellaceae bacterium]